MESLGQGGEDGFLLGVVEVHRELDVELDDEVPALVGGLGDGHALLGNDLGVGGMDDVCDWNIQSPVIQCSDLQCAACKGLGEGDGCGIGEVVALALEPRVWSLVQHEDDVAGFLPRLLVTVPLEGDLRAFLPALLDVDLDDVLVGMERL
eukprot:CAMPEP_0196654600 /NCGR_PEP_ID=MMETSP1086-20130531/4331_1 /TAXON_ID=77921 /ORGANISM="Cyanoptyche  gloeocystis , Strain SAG4.97" /LENGTH=149 /DNA_ID=CAMNT_0041986455 /DNA_START=96 /DNA_END=541 /DNA_ORIENTATION=-